MTTLTQRPIHDITVPYIARFIWNTGKAKEQWETRIRDARYYLLENLPRVLVDQGVAEFAPILRPELHTESIGSVLITNHYFCRWTTCKREMRSTPQAVREAGIYGKRPKDIDFHERWDLHRDLWQMALAPDCCKEAYFKATTEERDPYLSLYGDGNNVKPIASSLLNSLLAPIGLFLSPIAPCSLDCKHALAKAEEIEAVVKQDNPQVHETLKMVLEQPIKIDTYRSMAIVDTPMFKGVYGTDPYKEKYILKAKPQNPELFNYRHDWVAKGNDFPFKNQFSELLS